MSALPSSRVPAAVLWDMDGTLIDSEPLWLKSELSMLDRYGISLPDATRDALVGSGLQAAAGLFQDLGVPLSRDEIISEWASSVIDGLRTVGAEWRPGSTQLLASLVKAGIPCALVTMAVRSIADAVVATLPAGSFNVIVAGDEVAHEKPHPDPYLRGASLLGVDISECLALEDSPTGLGSAHASGAVAIGIPNLVDLSLAPAHELWLTLENMDADSLAERFAAHRA